MPWHFVGADEIAVTAAAAGLVVEEIWVEGGRWFACLRGGGGR
jgi:hypothetical protein